jgi:TPR repeat protein
VRLLLPALAIAVSLALPACHAQTPVAQTGPVTRSAVATAAPACAATGDTGDPFVVDWPSETRGDLEVAMKHTVAVLAVTCSSVRVLPDCSAEGAYSYIGTSEREEVLSFRSADELAVSLPLSAPKLTGPGGVDFAHEGSVDIAIASVGRWSATHASVVRSELKGECTGATHFVRSATLGAFAVGAGTAGHAKTAGDVFGHGVAIVKDGALEACRTANASNDAEVVQCGAPIRVQLEPIRDNLVAASTGGAAAPSCPRGMVRDDGDVCVRPSPDRAHICDPASIEDCTIQCDHGSMTSCSILGRSYALGRGVPKNLARATELLTKACAAGVNPACGRLGQIAVEAHDDAKGYPLLLQACSGGWVEGCRIAGTYAMLKPSPLAPKVGDMFKRSCLGGQPEGCWSLGAVYAENKPSPENDAEAVRWMQLACEGDAKGGCSGYAALVDEGRGVTADPGRAVSILVRACDQGRGAACAALADDYFKGHTVAKDVAKGVALDERACKGGDPGGCLIVGQRYRDGIGVPRDLAKATEYLTKACEAGIAAACALAKGL